MVIRHILLDLLLRDKTLEDKILKVINSMCSEIANSNTGRFDTKLYNCSGGLVIISKANNVLHIDLFDSESVFDSLLGVLPREYIVIRLIERGFP